MALMRRQDIKYLALEALVVVFGVLAALLVERVREERAHERAAAVAGGRLTAEVAQNLAELRDLQEVVQERVGYLRALREEKTPGSLAELVGRFEGYRTPDLSGAAWTRLSTSDLADAVDPQLMADAFYVYEWNRQFDQLEREINRLVYSELFYSPEAAPTAIAISERIMQQQLAWVAPAIPQLEAFLESVGSPVER